MVTKKAAETALDPKVFDLQTLMGKVKKPAPKIVKLFLAADLVDRIEELDKQIRESDDDSNAQRGIADADPVAELVAERNQLAEEFNASEQKFELRPVGQGDRSAIRAAMKADEISEDDPEAWLTEWVNYAVAAVCTSVVMPGADWSKFRDEVGEDVFAPLGGTVMAMFEGGQVRSVPFSPKSLPIRTNGKP